MKKAILLLTVLAVLVTACKDPFFLEDKKKSTDKTRTLEFVEIFNSNHAYQNDFNERQTIVVKSQVELDAFLSQMTGTTIPLPDFPQVDFNDKMLFGIVLPAQSSGSHKLKITAANMVEGVIEVSSELTIPNIGTDDIGYPVVFVELDRHSESVKFLDTKIIKQTGLELDNLLNKHWELTNIVETNGNIIDPNKYNGQGTNGEEIDLDPFTIQFKDDFTFSGYANCNNYGGSFAIDNNNLDILELWSTEAACSLSDFYQLLLNNAVSIDYSAQKYITITSEYGGLMYTLNYHHIVPEEDNILNGTKWKLESYSQDGGLTYESSYKDEDGNEVTFVEDKYTLDFGLFDNQTYYVEIFANCVENITDFSTNSKNNEISFKWFSTIDVMCGFSTQFHEMLFETTNYEYIYGGLDRLKLYDKSKNTVMLFVMDY